MPGPQGAAGAQAMSLGKLSPVGWVSSSQGKRRLTADMISPPLGDFRHTMHVGRGGDVFGDTSFLSNHGGTRRSPRSFLARKLQQVRRVGATPRQRNSRAAPSPAPPAVSPIIKNAISLPQLNQAAYDSLVVGPFGGSGYGLDSGVCTISRLPRQEKARERESSLPAEPQLRRSDSLQSFHLDLDLGPSLLSEFLGVMSFSEDSATEAPAPAPTSNPTALDTTPRNPVTSPRPPRGHCPNGVTAGSGPGTEARPHPAHEGPRVPADEAPSRRPHTELGAPWEPAEMLPRSGASWESLDSEWGTSQASSRGPVPSTVQVSTLAFADSEEDDEVKV